MASFKSYQREAKKNTVKYVILYILGMLSLLTVVNIAFLFLTGFRFQSFEINQNSQFVVSDLVHYKEHIYISVGFLIFVFIVVACNYFFYRRNTGDKIAKAVGGIKIDPTKKHLYDENIVKLININEEIAISSLKRPANLYVIEENGINAFAAGYGEEYVVGVTRGALNKLNREELQAVVAHEYSHIHNKDMEINLKFIAFISGLYFFTVIGSFILDATCVSSYGRSRDDGKTKAFMLILGLLLFLFGWVGGIFAKIMQATISRQREYLADASAVEFTRNPKGLVSTLSKIKADSEQYLPKDERFNHIMFIGKLNSLLSSHPDINLRIARFSSQ